MRSTTASESIVLQANKSGKLEAKEILLADNMGLIYAYARRYDPTIFNDIVQEGCIGLLTAADHYEFDRGTKFSTYATFWINQAIHKGYQNLKHDVRIPATTLECIQKIKKVITAYMTEKHRVPTSEEIQEATGINPTKVEYYQQISKDIVSLDAIGGDNEESYVNYIEDESANNYQTQLDEEGLYEALHAAISELSLKEQAVISAHFGFTEEGEISLAEIGRGYEISRERVRQIKDRAIEKIKKGKYGKKIASFL